MALHWWIPPPPTFSRFGTIWLLSVPQHEQVSDRWWGHNYLHLRTLSRIRMRASIPRKSKRCNTDGRYLWTAGETIMKITTFSQIRQLHHSQPMNFSAHAHNFKRMGLCSVTLHCIYLVHTQKRELFMLRKTAAYSFSREHISRKCIISHILWIHHPSLSVIVHTVRIFFKVKPLIPSSLSMFYSSRVYNPPPWMSNMWNDCLQLSKQTQTNSQACYNWPRPVASQVYDIFKLVK